MADSQTVRQLALAMANVHERPCYGTPAFYAGRKLFARLLEDGDTLVVKIDYSDRERRMKADPNTFFITDHYLNYPMMIVRLPNVDVTNLRELLEDARNRAGS